jgi:hypothetical protein
MSNAQDPVEKGFRLSVPKVHPLASAVLGVLLILGAAGLKNWVGREASERHADLDKLERCREQVLIAQNNALSLKDLKEQDLTRFKAGLSGAVRSKRALYEAGLSAQEEKRLLEKQLEIMTTYLMIDQETRRISLMRGEQILKSYPMAEASPRAFGGYDKPLPTILRIISKERFAHPERGKSEMVDGKLQWNPPQVGTSVRSNALGEYVMFTQGGLILHGPPRKAQEHATFPHYCLELPLATARDLYRNSFIGTKILLAVTKTEN